LRRKGWALEKDASRARRAPFLIPRTVSRRDETIVRRDGQFAPGSPPPELACPRRRGT
jgi:hypothetical protein